MKVAPARMDLIASLNRSEIQQVQDLGWSLILAPRAVRAMLLEARKHAPLETMGPLFMSGSVEAGFRVELAAPSGPKAEHQALTCMADDDFYNRWVRWGWNRRSNLWFVGQWHTHPFQDVPGPSPWDIWGANQDRTVGWFAWNEDYFEGRGHLEIIMAARVTRAWWITTNPDRIRLVCEVQAGIATPEAELRQILKTGR